MNREKVAGEIKKNLLSVLSLAVLLLVGFGTFLSVGYNPFLQLLTALIISLGYFLWGILYHLSQGDVSYKIVVEYFIFSALFFTLITLLIQS